MSAALYHATDHGGPLASALRYFESKAADPVGALRLAQPNRHTAEFSRDARQRPGRGPAVAATPEQHAGILRRWNAGERLASITRRERLPRDIVWRIISAAGEHPSSVLRPPSSA